MHALYKVSLGKIYAIDPPQEISLHGLTRRSRGKISVRDFLARSLQEISLQGCCTRSLEEVSWQDAARHLYTRSLGKVAVKDLFTNLCTRQSLGPCAGSLQEVPGQDLCREFVQHMFHFHQIQRAPRRMNIGNEKRGLARLQPRFFVEVSEVLRLPQKMN